MDDNTVVIAVAAIIVNGFVIAAIARAWIARRPLPPQHPPRQLENIEMRIIELQQAVDDVAIEVERLAEGQRFTAKLLAEKAGEAGE